ncbi:MAG: molybdate ABC transporter substrate-binding protein [Magnetococcales bacterium]|nr:molybdate ABC transporter substrate-binding protein [Magnetococcales bacterium]
MRYLFVLWLLFYPCVAASQTVHVAVAANFKQPMEKLADIFAAQTQHDLLISTGSTGKLYAQIVNGAPFQVFFAADQKRPTLLAQAGLADKQSQFTYAMGRLALWVPGSKNRNINREYLHKKKARPIALSNPKVAPYGMAAKEVLQFTNSWKQHKNNMAFAENVGQTLAFVASGGVDSGFVALSQLKTIKADPKNIWIIPHQYYNPIRQDAVVINQHKSNPGVLALMKFLKTANSKNIIKAMGYAVP